jgi:hypothetical protein
MNLRNKYATLKILNFIICLALFFGCSATRTISDKTVETTTIQPVTIQVDDIKTETQVVLTKVDTLNKIPYGEYVPEPIKIEQKMKDGSKIKTTAVIKSTLIKNKKGMPELKSEVTLTETTIETKAQVTAKTETTKSVTETFWQIWGNRFMWGLIIIIILSILWGVFKSRTTKFDENGKIKKITETEE